ncbi:MAG: zf-HC2 domain-containing protein [Betaproteobacteria bacterium]
MRLRLTCQEATRMMSGGQDRSLGPGERLRLRAHLLVCSGCAAFEKQLEFLSKVLRRLAARE